MNTKELIDERESRIVERNLRGELPGALYDPEPELHAASPSTALAVATGELKTLTPTEVESSRYTGYLRGEYFMGEWLDTSDMAGYGIYHCVGGKSMNTASFPKAESFVIERMRAIS